ncbi:Exosortase [Halorhabdus sp. SVX81]|uniref:archaeosortase A n=1 Tax=Halorhabdus sp. SVX81 TaxID=2978283 RepID=UPI0023DA8861|nr:archaeosortase A [Halorhabdus sp. SVX81]WEL17508.1 Exosortase [Halorhabdus sp. SVX81]
MIETVVDWLAALNGYAGTLAWVVLAIFLAGVILERYDETWAQRVYAGAWIVLAGYWLAYVHYFVFAEKSITEGIGVVIGIPLSLYVAYLIANGRRRLFVISRAVAFAWLFFLPLSSLPFVRQPLIETVTVHTDFVLGLLGDNYFLGDWYPYLPAGLDLPGGYELPTQNDLPGKHFPYRNTFLYAPDGHSITYTIRLACTGIGSMSIFVGLIAAVRGSLRRKAKAIGVAIGVIYVLNIVRNVFIAHTLGNQRLHIVPDIVMSLFSTNDPYMVSYYVGDRILAQFGSVFALIAITWLVVQWVPDVLTVVEDGLYVVTGTEYDLKDALDVESSDH